MDGLVRREPRRRPRAGAGSLPAKRTPRRRSRCGCGRAPSTSWSARSSCARPGSPLRQLIEGDQSMSLLLWGPPGHRQDHDRRDPQPADRPALRRGLRGLGRGEGGARGHRRRPRRAGRTAATRRCCSSTRCTGSPRPSRTPCCPASRTAGSRWSPPPPRTRSSRVISPLLSRSLLLRLESLTDDDVRAVVDQALADERGSAGAVTLDDDALDHLVRLAGGDARRSLTYLEAAAGGGQRPGPADDRPRHRRDGGRPGGGPLRPAGRPALRRHQRVHQVDPRLRRRRRAALPGPDDRGRGGPAVHRPAAGRSWPARTSAWPTRPRCRRP